MDIHNPHIGSTFESWLDAQGIPIEAPNSAIKAVIACSIPAMRRSRSKHCTGRRKSRGAKSVWNWSERVQSPARKAQGGF
jgi:hypothetical protein